MRIGVIGDIHGNLPALERAQQLLVGRGIDCCICVGDIIDGGPHPNACIELVRDWCLACVQGNHDENPDASVTPTNRSWLTNLPRDFQFAGWLFTHFSPRNNRDKITNSALAWSAFEDAEFDRACVGHAHVRRLYKYDPKLVADCTDIPFHQHQARLHENERYLYINPSLAYSRDRQELMCSIIYAGGIETLVVDQAPIHHSRGLVAHPDRQP